jgi:peptidyl-prolyl cis-trans isomerase C
MESIRMKSLVLSLVASTALLCQTTPQPAAPSPGGAAQAAPGPVSLLNMPPNAVVATIDGQKVLAGDLQVILRALSPAQQEASLKNPRAFLDNFALMQHLSAMAEKAGLDQTSPLKEQLAYNRRLALAQAQLQASEAQQVVTQEDIQKFYDGNKDLYTSVRVKAIYIPFSAGAASQPGGSEKKVLSEAEAKTKAEKVYADLQAGADFVKMVKENSGDPNSAAKDGDFGTFHRSDNIPEEVKKTVFALKPKEVSRPVRLANGYYIFRAEENSLEPLDMVRNQIMQQLRDRRMNEWVQATQKSIQIKIDNEAAFLPAPAPEAAK